MLQWVALSMGHPEDESERHRRIDEEAAALWQALHHAPPPSGVTGTALIDAALSASEAPRYQMLANPWLRDRNLVLPR
jgi:hypothetical protein